MNGMVVQMLQQLCGQNFYYYVSSSVPRPLPRARG